MGRKLLRTACRTRELSAELTVTRAYWRKQNPPVCGEILRVFRHACQKSFKILPHTGGTCLLTCSRVTVSSADSSRVRQAYAFLNGGSDTTLCLETLVQELAVQDAKPTKYTTTKVNCQQQKSGYEVQLDIESVSGGERFQLEGILTTDSLPMTPRHVATNEEVRRWPHLQDIILPETGDKQVTILTGSDRPDIINSCLDRRDGTKAQPCAVKTPLEWTLYGPMGESEKKQVSVSFARSEFDILDRKLERMYNAEFDDINDDVVENMSVEDRRAEDIMNMTTVLKDGHYQIGLPFKHNPPRFPDSLPTAKKRLEYFE